MPGIDRALAGWMDAYAAPEANAATLHCDRHDPDAVTFRFVDAELTSTELTDGELADRSRRLAAALAERGVRRGNRVEVLMSKRPELVVRVLAIWRLGAVHVPLLPPLPAARSRSGSRARRRGCSSPSGGAPETRRARQRRRPPDRRGARRARHRVYAAGRVQVRLRRRSLLLYTGATTGQAERSRRPAEGPRRLPLHLRCGLDVHADDVYWIAADPCWAYGLLLRHRRAHGRRADEGADPGRLHAWIDGGRDTGLRRHELRRAPTM